MPSLASIRNKAAQYISKGDYERAVEEYNKALEIEPNDANTHNLLGEAYLKMRKREGAISEFERALELYTKDAFYTNSIAVCRKILRLDADRAEVYRDLGDLYAKQGLLGEAIANLMEFADRKRSAGDMDQVFDAYHKTIELMPKKTDIRMKLVEMYLAQEMTSEAVEELRKVRDIFREQGKVDDADGIETRIEALAGPAEAAAVAAEEAAVPETEEIAPPPVEVPPADLGDEIRFEQISSDLVTETSVPTVEEVPSEMAGPPVLGEGLLVEKVAGLESLFQKPPADWATYMELGDLCLAIGSSDEAIDYYYRAADAYYEERSYTRAEDIYRKVADLRPFELRPRQKLVQAALQKNDTQGTVEAYLSLGDCLRRRGAVGEADSVYKKALRLDPQNSLVRQKLGKPEEEVEAPYPEEEVAVEVEAVPEKEPAAEEFVDFAELLKEEVEEMAREPQSRAELPTMEKLAEEFKEEIYSKVTEGDYSAHYELGIAYREMGLMDDAIAEFQIASKGEGERLKSLEVLAICFLEKGELKLAEEHVRQGLELEGHTEEERIGLHYQLGLLCEKMGRLDEAKKEYEEVLAIDKEFKDVAERLEQAGKPQG